MGHTDTKKARVCWAPKPASGVILEGSINTIVWSEPQHTLPFWYQRVQCIFPSTMSRFVSPPAAWVARESRVSLQASYEHVPRQHFFPTLQLEFLDSQNPWNPDMT